MQSSYATRTGTVRHILANWETVGNRWRAWRQSSAAGSSPGLIGYGAIILALSLTAILQVLTSRFLGEHIQFLIFIPAVLTAAFLGGFRFGALVTTTSLALTLHAVGETGGDDLHLLLNSAAFGVIAIGLSIFGDTMHRTRCEAGKSNRDLTAILETMPGAMIRTLTAAPPRIAATTYACLA